MYNRYKYNNVWYIYEDFEIYINTNICITSAYINETHFKHIFVSFILFLNCFIFRFFFFPEIKILWVQKKKHYVNERQT